MKFSTALVLACVMASATAFAPPMATRAVTAKKAPKAKPVAKSATKAVPAKKAAPKINNPFAKKAAAPKAAATATVAAAKPKKVFVKKVFPKKAAPAPKVAAKAKPAPKKVAAKAKPAPKKVAAKKVVAKKVVAKKVAPKKVFLKKAAPKKAAPKKVAKPVARAAPSASTGYPMWSGAKAISFGGKISGGGNKGPINNFAPPDFSNPKLQITRDPAFYAAAALTRTAKNAGSEFVFDDGLTVIERTQRKSIPTFLTGQAKERADAKENLRNDVIAENFLFGLSADRFQLLFITVFGLFTLVGTLANAKPY